MPAEYVLGIKNFTTQDLESLLYKIKNKGIQKAVINKNMNIKLFEDCLFDNKNNYQVVQRFGSDKHEVKLFEINKLALKNSDKKDLIVKMELIQNHLYIID